MPPTLCPPLHKLACVCPIPVPVRPAAVVNQCQQKQISCPRSSRNIEDGHPALELRKRSYREAARSKETPVNKAINKAAHGLYKPHGQNSRKMPLPQSLQSGHTCHQIDL